jgi:hypothetical protein
MTAMLMPQIIRGDDLKTSFQWSHERTFTGYIFDPRDPGRKFVVELLVDGIPVKCVRANERLGTDQRETIESEIAMSEESHTAITRRNFGVNWRDPENYDLVLSTERLSVDECVDEVELAMKHGRFQETGESLRLVDNLALSWSVRAALRRDERTKDTDITVECDAGEAKLLGIVTSLQEALAAEAVAAIVAGVKSVSNQVQATLHAASRARREG